MTGFTLFTGVWSLGLGVQLKQEVITSQAGAEYYLLFLPDGFIWSAALINIANSISKPVLLIILAGLFVLLLVCIIAIIYLNKKARDKENEFNQLQRNSSKLSGLNHDKNRFISMVSHDIRSPLNSISGISDLLHLDADKLKASEIKEYAGTIQNLVIRIRHLVNNMLDANKIEQGEVKLSLEPVNLEKLIELIKDSVHLAAKNKNIKIRTEVEQNLPAVNADKEALYSIIENLTSNALKFSGENSEILISASQRDDKIQINVKDSGPGFSEEDKEKVFSKFSKLSAKPTGKEKTTGLGLYIVKNLVKELNGSITLKSKKGEGAEFNILLNTA